MPAAPATAPGRSPTSSPAATSTTRSRRRRTSPPATPPPPPALQDFARRVSDILEARQSGDLLVITSDHGCDPTTESTDHSREHALLLAYAAGRNAAGRVHGGGEFGGGGSPRY